MEDEIDDIKRAIKSREKEIELAEQREVELKERIKSNKSKKAKAEMELDVQKKRCTRYKNKLERQKNAGRRLESELYSYVGAMKKLEISSSNEAQNNANAVDACIASIDSYMSVNL